MGIRKMRVFFADAYYFIARINQEDQHHDRVIEFSKTMRASLVTTDWVLMEVADALAGFTGGAGYIGSNTTLQLLDAGYDVVVVDSLARGHREAVDPARLRVLDLLDTEGLVAVMNEKPCQAVIHFAAYIAVGESMQVPEIYFDNNVAGSLSLLTAMLKAGMKTSSSPPPPPSTESRPRPHIRRRALRARQRLWRIEGHGGNSARLVRPHPPAYQRLPALLQRLRQPTRQGAPGEQHEPETHLIPLLLRAVTPASRHALRRRLRYPGRHLHPRLHPRHRPRKSPHRRRGMAHPGRGIEEIQRRRRPGLLSERSPESRRRSDRKKGAVPVRTQARGRPTPTGSGLNSPAN